LFIKRIADHARGRGEYGQIADAENQALGLKCNIDQKKYLTLGGLAARMLIVNGSRESCRSVSSVLAACCAVVGLVVKPMTRVEFFPGG